MSKQDFNPQDAHVLALDIGGTNTRLGLVSQGGALFAYQGMKSALWNGENAMDNLGALIENYLATEAKGARVVAVAMGFPGAVSKNRRSLENVPTIPSLNGLPVADILQARLKLPVFIDRDVVMLYAHAAGEINLPKTGLTLCFFVGTGMGNLLVFDGKAYTGARGIAGELGHIPLFGQTLRCGCGHIGCAELYCAGHALVRMRGEHFPGEDPDLLFPLHLEHPAVQEYLEILAQVLATEMIILDPDRVMLGGGIVAMPEFPLEFLRQKVASKVRSPESAIHIPWHVAPEAQRAGVIGAGRYGFERLGE